MADETGVVAGLDDICELARKYEARGLCQREIPSPVFQNRSENDSNNARIVDRRFVQHPTQAYQAYCDTTLPSKRIRQVRLIF